MPMSFVSEPIFFIACICCRKSSRVNSSPASNFRAISAAAFFVECLLGMLDESQHVAHVENARSHAIGMELFEVLRFSPVDANMTGRPVTSRTDSAAPPRASPSSFVRTTPSKSDAFLERDGLLFASCPIIASITKRTSLGSTASRIPRAWAGHEFFVNG